MLNDDCLGRTLDWLYAHDPTKLFAGIASRARQIFGIKAQQVHVDTIERNAPQWMIAASHDSRWGCAAVLAAVRRQ
jgi:hypothetical protein